MVTNTIIFTECIKQNTQQKTYIIYAKTKNNTPDKTKVCLHLQKFVEAVQRYSIVWNVLTIY